MPIGVPKVPYRLPGESSAQWVDIYNRLYRERLLFLCQDLDDEVANLLMGIMVYLNAEEKTKDIYIFINSLGGSVTCGIGVYDVMNFVEADVSTICIGTAASMASFVLAGGEKGKRVALPHTRLMIHQPEGGGGGQASEVFFEAEEVMRLRQKVGEIYTKLTKQNINIISRDMDRDQYMSAREAKNYGLVDQVAIDVKWSSTFL